MWNLYCMFYLRSFHNAIRNHAPGYNCSAIAILWDQYRSTQGWNWDRTLVAKDVSCSSTVLFFLNKAIKHQKISWEKNELILQWSFVEGPVVKPKNIEICKTDCVLSCFRNLAHDQKLVCFLRTWETTCQNVVHNFYTATAKIQWLV